MKLDNNKKGDTFAVLAVMIDWKQAFPRQDPTLGVQSFINNGVRGTLIPLLVNYFLEPIYHILRLAWIKLVSAFGVKFSFNGLTNSILKYYTMFSSLVNTDY